MNRLGRRLEAKWAWLVVALFGALSMGALAASASAAVVTAYETQGSLRPVGPSAGAEVKAQPAEANRLSVSLGGAPGQYILQVRDGGGPIAAGEGCVGGGAAGSVVSCALAIQPGSVAVVLGNGGSSLDASSLSSSVTVWAGSGDDSIVTGSGDDSFIPTRCIPNPLYSSQCDPELVDGKTGNDRILSGAGDDWADLGTGSTEFRGGPGDDWALASAQSNGPDTIDLGAGDHDIADYRLRQQPLTYVADDLANDGEAGEGDAVLDAEFFVAGNGDDLLVGDGSEDFLFGGGGDDLLAGNGGDDWLVGEQGREDNLGFVQGIDVTRFRSSYPTPSMLTFEPGADRALGGEGNDRLYLDKGGDSGFGGPGNDLIKGDRGRDRLFGQRGANRLDGGANRDRCRGGSRVSVLLGCEP